VWAVWFVLIPLLSHTGKWGVLQGSRCVGLLYGMFHVVCLAHAMFVEVGLCGFVFVVVQIYFYFILYICWVLAVSNSVVHFIIVLWVTWGAFVPKAFASPCPGFRPWEIRAWWWSRFKEPPL